MKKLQPFSSRRIPLGLLCCSLLIVFWLAACANQPAQQATTPAPDAVNTTDANATNGGANGQEATGTTDAVTTTGETASTTSNATSGAPVSPLSSPLAQPTPTATPIPRFETEEGTGVVTGYLLLQTEEGVKPVYDVVIALAPILRDAAGNEAVVGYDRIGAPRDITDENGFFAITGVPPDRYGFILDVVVSSYLLAQPDGSGDMLITMEGGEQIDMGPLVYHMLPLARPLE